MSQCRSSIISKCIELYPESLANPDKDRDLPLHKLLWNNITSIGIAVMVIAVIEKHPAALKHRNRFRHLPLHIECWSKFRPSVTLKCIKPYPASATMVDKRGHIHGTIHCPLGKNFQSRKTSALSSLLASCPAAFYHPPHDPLIDKFEVMRDPGYRRVIFFHPAYHPQLIYNPTMI
jgi:hypothetical protein